MSCWRKRSFRSGQTRRSVSNCPRRPAASTHLAWLSWSATAVRSAWLNNARTARLASRLVRPLGATDFHVEVVQFPGQQILVEAGHGQRADADLETVQRGLALVDVVLHVPEVAELVFRAGGGPAGLRRLHREAAEHQTLPSIAGPLRGPGSARLPDWPPPRAARLARYPTPSGQSLPRPAHPPPASPPPRSSWPANPRSPRRSSPPARRKSRPGQPPRPPAPDS